MKCLPDGWACPSCSDKSSELSRYSLLISTRIKKKRPSVGQSRSNKKGDTKAEEKDASLVDDWIKLLCRRQPSKVPTAECRRHQLKIEEGRWWIHETWPDYWISPELYLSWPALVLLAFPSSEHSKCEKHSTMSYAWSPDVEIRKGSWVIEIPFQTNRRFAHARFHRLGRSLSFAQRRRQEKRKTKKKSKRERTEKKSIPTVSYAELLMLIISRQFLGILELPFKKRTNQWT